jgi:arsenate reductase (thioredoxin)
MTHTILFLCPHGAAKSIMAAAYFQQRAKQQGLDMQATAAGTEPSAEVSPSVAELLAKEGINVSHIVPQRVTDEKMASAFHVVSLGCELDALPLSNAAVERWDDVPVPSQNLMAARNRIYERVALLVEQYKQYSR